MLDTVRIAEASETKVHPLSCNAPKHESHPRPRPETASFLRLLDLRLRRYPAILWACGIATPSRPLLTHVPEARTSQDNLPGETGNLGRFPGSC